jgi:phospholipid/cholesterol/gamma-HCH transport system substrate-binding protein
MMNKETSHNIRLGVFVTSGIILLIVALYFIGNNKNLFGSTFKLYATFYNVNGLQKGNNVRYSGIDVGTVENIEIKNDTAIRVEMIIEEDLKKNIRKNSLASIGTDGLMGNKLVNIDPGSNDSPLINEGDELPSIKAINTEDMLRTLELTNQNIAVVSADLKDVTGNISKSRGTLYKVLMDTSLAKSLQNVLDNFASVSNDLSTITGKLSSLVADVKNGKGTAGMLLKDTLMSSNLEQTIGNVKKSSERVAEMSENLNNIIQRMDKQNGTIGTLINDTTLAGDLKQSIKNIQSGSDNFNQNMEALKHNFLFKGYFKKQEKKKTQLEDKK